MHSSEANVTYRLRKDVATKECMLLYSVKRVLSGGPAVLTFSTPVRYLFALKFKFYA